MTHSEAIYKIGRELTPRLKQMCLLLVNGYTTNAELARAMGCSPDTVKQHMHAASIITGMGNRTELALYVIRNPEKFRSHDVGC
jgi:DNA-binding CsgD family transcriptional regulator